MEEKNEVFRRVCISGLSDREIRTDDTFVSARLQITWAAYRILLDQAPVTVR